MTEPTSGDLDASFQRAVQARGGEYATARASIVHDPAAPSFLQGKMAAGAGWRERLTAEALLGWIQHKPKYDEAFAWLKDKRRHKTNTALGRALVGDIAEEIAALGAEVTPWVLETLLVTREQETEWEQSVLVLTLVKLRDARAYDPMLAVLTDRGEEESLRAGAALVLKALGDLRAVPALAGVAADASENEQARKSAAGALATLDPVQAVPVLEALLPDARTPLALKSQVASQLGELRSPSSKPVLEQSFKSETDPMLLATLALSLGAVGDAGTVALLRATHKRTTDTGVRETCEDAIREIERR